MKMYNDLAPISDFTYLNKDYKKEVDFIAKILHKNKIKKGLIYDVACGSGNHSKLLLKKGYQVEGSDMNKGMLKLAKKNIKGFKTTKQDMRKFKMKKPADCIITMFNAINHLQSYTDFENMLKSYKKNIVSGGLIIFDTMFDQKNWDKEFTGVKKLQKGKMTICKTDYSMKLSKNKGYVEQYYVVSESGKKGTKIYKNKYTNFIYEIPRMKKIIKKLDLKCKIYYNFSLKEKYSQHCSYVFVLQKK